MTRPLLELMELDSIACQLRDLLAKVDRLRAPRWTVEADPSRYRFLWTRGALEVSVEIPRRERLTPWQLRIGSHSLSEDEARSLEAWLRQRVLELDGARAMGPAIPANLDQRGEREQAAEGKG